MEMKSILLGCVMALTPVMIRADVAADAAPPPTTLPSYAPDHPEFPRGPENFRSFGRGFPLNRLPGGGDVTDSDWEETSTFMREHSPVRLKMIESLRESRMKNGLKSVAIQSFRMYQHTKEKDQELADVILNRIELEDQATDLAHQSRTSDGASKESITQQLKDKISALIDTTLKERQIRIVRLETTLAGEKERLAKDTAQRDKLIENRTKAYLNRDWPNRPTGNEPHTDAMPAQPQADPTAVAK